MAQSPSSSSAAASAQANIGVDGFFSADKAQRGRTIQAAVVMDIPEGFHINSNKPLSKYSIPTTIKIEAPGGVRVGPVSYPRAVVRRFKFEGRSEEERLAVYEGRAVMRFNITVPADFEPGVTELRVRVRYQSCDDRVCYPPATRDITLPIGVVGASDPVRRINGQIFGGGGRSPRGGRRG